MDATTIQEGSRVIIKRGSYLRSEVVNRKKKVNVQKLRFFLDNAIGYTFGSTFNIEKNGNLTLIKNSHKQCKQAKISGENNQFINDDGQSQKLTKDAIMELKEQGFAGEDIIEQLIENSDTFEKKTEYSQEKYLKKKRNRHVPEITILKPTPRLVCEMMYGTASSKIQDLRPDTLSQILTMANIQSGLNVILLENTQSFLAGAILHQMGGQGNVVQLFNGDFPIRLMLPHFALTEDEAKVLCGFPMHKINNVQTLEVEDCLPASNVVTEDVDGTACEGTEQNCEDAQESCSQSDKEDLCSDDREPRTKRKNVNKPLTKEEKFQRKQNRSDEERRALQLLKAGSFDSLIVATKFRAKPAVLKLVEFLSPSRPIVVYSLYKEVLRECYVALKEQKCVINLDLTETWWRAYQVLPMRTHPAIMMDGTGGYLLTGIKVASEPSLEKDTSASHNPSADSANNPDSKTIRKLEAEKEGSSVSGGSNVERDSASEPCNEPDFTPDEGPTEPPGKKSRTESAESA